MSTKVTASHQNCFGNRKHSFTYTLQEEALWTSQTSVLSIDAKSSVGCAGGSLSRVDRTDITGGLASVFYGVDNQSALQALIDTNSSQLRAAGIQALTFTTFPCAASPQGYCPPGQRHMITL